MSAALTLAAKLSTRVDTNEVVFDIVIVNRIGKTVETVGSIAEINAETALEVWTRDSVVVQSGVKGASRIVTTVFADRADAEAFAARVRRSNSIGSYWAEIID